MRPRHPRLDQLKARITSQRPRTVIASFYSVDEAATKSDRMIIRHEVSITFPLFTSQVERIRAVPGVREVSRFCWFAGVYRDDKQRFGQQAVEAPSYFEIYPEYRFQPAELEAWLADPAGAAAGDALAKKYGWKIGDRIPIQARSIRGSGSSRCAPSTAVPKRSITTCCSPTGAT